MSVWTRLGLSGPLLGALALACTTAPPTTGPTSPPQPVATTHASPAAVASPSPLVATASPGAGPSVRQLGSFTFQDKGTRAVKDLSELDLEADDFYFSPTFLQGAPGQNLKLHIENEGEVQHNFSIGGQGVDTDIPPDGKADVEVTFPASGALRFFCKYHAGQGMNGELLAGDATPQPVSESRGY